MLERLPNDVRAWRPEGDSATPDATNDSLIPPDEAAVDKAKLKHPLEVFGIGSYLLVN